MSRTLFSATVSISAVASLLFAMPATANAYREKGKPVLVAGSALKVVPARDWNQLSIKPGKKAETWTLDGEQLNDVTFFGAIGSGEPLIRERSKKRDPLPKFTRETLLVEVPELLERTYRTAKRISQFNVVNSVPATFLGREGIQFAYEYTDEDKLTRKGEARASIIGGKLYMVTYDAPRLHFFDKQVQDFRALADSALLP